MNIQNVMQALQNPQEILRRAGIPEEYMKNPQTAAQYLLENGKVTQEQIQRASSIYQQLKGNARS